jgi:hypothetical protein
MFLQAAHVALRARQISNKSVILVGARRRIGSNMIRMKKKSLGPGARVVWVWDGRKVEGVIRKVFTHRLERTINGATVTRPCTKRNPAYLIEQEGGLQLLLNFNELRQVAI